MSAKKWLLQKIEYLFTAVQPWEQLFWLELKELKTDQGKEEELFPLKYAIRTLSLVDKSLGMPYLVWSYFAAKFQSGNIVIHCGQKRNDTEESVNCLQKETYQWQLKMKLEN